MSRQYRWAVSLMLALVLATPLGAAPFFFDDPSKVNVLDSYDAGITAAFTSGSSGAQASSLRGRHETNYGWDGGILSGGQKNSLTVDFKRARNIQTIRTWSNFGSYNINSATVETSDDGVIWTSCPHTLTVLDAGKTRVEIGLSSAVDARYLRVIGETYQSGPSGGENGRWIVNDLRVFGNPGSLEAGTSIDIVSRSALSNGVTLSRNIGTVSITDTNDNEYVDDALNPLKRGVMFSMGTGDGFTLQFDRDGDFRHFAFWGAATGTPDFNARFVVEASDNAGPWVTLLDRTGYVSGYNVFPLTLFTGDALRFRFVSTTSSDNRISDVQVFVPEPMGFTLIGLGATLVSRRRCL